MSNIDILKYGFVLHETIDDDCKVYHLHYGDDGYFLKLYVAFGYSFTLFNVSKKGHITTIFNRYELTNQSQLDFLLKCGRVGYMFLEPKPIVNMSNILSEYKKLSHSLEQSLNNQIEKFEKEYNVVCLLKIKERKIEIGLSIDVGDMMNDIDTIAINPS